ncbi:MAG: S49 family peptidase [Thioalkalivibrionaceae bacterium]
MPWKNEAGKQSSDPLAPGWERRTLEQIAIAQIEEQRRARRWGIFFKFVIFAYLFVLLFAVRGVDLPFSLFGDDDKQSRDHVAVVDVSGVIAADSATTSADVLNRQLRAAFTDDNTRAVMLRILSGGGSPVQSAMIYDEIRRLREAHEVPVYAVIKDIGASGAYYIAAAADEIYASPSSLVGSIGVRLDSFGFVDAIDRIGVERRLFTAGESKGLLDPFLPVVPAEREHIERTLADVHQQFIKAVETGRGDRLRSDQELFTGLIWTGREAVELGLIDGLGTDRSVARDVIGIDRLVDFSPRQSVFRLLLDEIGIQVSSAIFSSLAEPRLR